MRPRGPIADHLDALARALAFDPALARRVAKEAEDHLREAADAAGGDAEAERCAVAAFGDARALARQYAATALTAQTRRIGSGTVLALAGIFAVMEARVAWYGLMQWGLADALKELNAVALPLDRDAFLLAAVFAIAAFIYLGSRRAPRELHPAYGRQLVRGVALCAAAACALLVSVAIETVLTAFRLLTAEPCSAALVPAATIAAEAACAGALVWSIGRASRRAMRAAALLRH
jgi:hypothetical protein